MTTLSKAEDARTQLGKIKVNDKASNAALAAAKADVNALIAELQPAPVEPAPPASEPESPPVSPAEKPLYESGFEEGLKGWNTAGVGEATPTVVTSPVSAGTHSARFLLTGKQDRSELIFGGDGSGAMEAIESKPGEDFWFGFDFNIAKMVYGKPGGHNLIMQFKGSDEQSPRFGISLWDYAGTKGIWTCGYGMEKNKSGERFLSAVSEQAWHRIVMHVVCSKTGTGSYELYLDGKLIDSNTNVSTLEADAAYGYIKNGIYRNGVTVPGTSEVFFDQAKLGRTQASVS